MVEGIGLLPGFRGPTSGSLCLVSALHFAGGIRDEPLYVRYAQCPESPPEETGAPLEFYKPGDANVKAFRLEP